MMRRTFLIAAILCLCALSPSSAQEAAQQPTTTPTPKEAARIETATRAEPIMIGFEDLAELELQLEQMRQRQRAAQPGSGIALLQRRQQGESTPQDPDTSKGQRTITIDVPIFGGGGESFRFVDVTFRDVEIEAVAPSTDGQPDRAVQSLDQRRTAVEKIRRNLAKKSSRR